MGIKTKNKGERIIWKGMKKKEKKQRENSEEKKKRHTKKDTKAGRTT